MGARKPTNLLKFTGAFNKDPQRERARKNEPKDHRPIGNPPSKLSPAEKKCWAALVDCSIPGVLTYADRPLLVAASQLYNRMLNQRGLQVMERRELIEDIEAADLEDPETLRITLIRVVRYADKVSDWKSSDQANFLKILGQMGMMPADRSKIIMPTKEVGNEFEADGDK